MPSAIDARLAELGITLPEASAPAATYVSFAVSGPTVYISGQISRATAASSSASSAPASTPPPAPPPPGPARCS